MFDGLRERAAGAGYAAGWGLLKTMPPGLSARAFRAAADAATVRNGGSTRQLRKNLRRVVGPAMSELRMDALVGDALRSYARYWMETFRLPAMDVDDIVARMDANESGSENIRTSLDRGQGVVLALPHSGNWDTAACWLVHHYGSFTTVAERLKPDSLFDRFVAFRESLGMEVIALTGGERAPTDVLTERLRANGVVALVADRDLSHHGIEVDFFGEKARMPAGPALLAATTGAALHPVHCRFVGDDSWAHWVGPRIELPEGRLRERVTHGTQAIADNFATRIGGYPADWHMLQRLWLADLPARPSPAADPSAASVR